MNWNKISLNNVYKKPKKRKKSKKTKHYKIPFKKKQELLQKRQVLYKYSKQLNKNLPKSEVWFQSIYKKYRFIDNNKVFTDHYNYPIGYSYIADVANLGFKYIVEVDGSIHDTKKQKAKDLKKDKFYKRKRFKVFRVKAYDSKRLDEVIKQICAIRNNRPVSVKNINNYYVNQLS